MNWNRANPEPTPEQLAAWADGELDRADAERVETWLASRPEAAQQAEDCQRLVHLYRDTPPPEPAEHAWQAVFAGIDAGLSAAAAGVPHPPAWSRWRLRLFIGVAAAAAVVGGVLLARPHRPDPLAPPRVAEVQPAYKPDAEGSEEPFEVASVSEVNIISIDAADADRVVMGQPLLGTFEVAAPEDIEIVKMEPHPDHGQTPHLHRGSEVPMIVVAAADREVP